ncbi:hypothetical protein BASA81_010293 [Batrachochytrium salamandrivorans]|nr:hypothetical protein BASA81_010293 [Batrachochytrium salamandrivorans]
MAVDASAPPSSEKDPSVLIPKPDPTALLSGQVTVEAGMDFEIPVVCYAGCVLQWRFPYVDLEFGLYVDGDDNAPALIPMQRTDPNQTEIQGLFQISQACTVAVRFSNSFSYFTAKLLEYEIALEEPLGGSRGPRVCCVPQVLFVLGGPGSGKRTNCSRLAKEFGFLHVSPGDVLWEEQQTNPTSDYARMISHCMANGEKVPAAVTVLLLWRKIRQSSRKWVLVDGFPNNVGDVVEWQRGVGKKSKIVATVQFDLQDDQVVTTRLLARGGEKDNLAAITLRLQTFREEAKLQSHIQFPQVLIPMTAGDSQDAVYDRLCAVLREPDMVGPTFPSLRDYFSLPVTNQQHQQQMPRDLPQTQDPFDSLVVDWDLAPSAIALQLVKQPEQVPLLLLEHVPASDEEEEEEWKGLDLVLEACDSLYRQHQFHSLGLKNFPAWQVVNVYHICASRGWVKPSVCVAKYTCLDRHVEAELLPALHAIGMSFHPEFVGNCNEPAAWQAFGLSELEANVCWLYYHSKLRGGDVIECGGLVKRIMPLPLSLGVWLEQLGQQRRGEGE